MHDAATVGVLERTQDVDRDSCRERPIEALGLADHALPGLAAHELHREDETAILLSEIVEVNDVGMIELRQGARFFDETRFHLGMGRKFGRQNLERHFLLGQLVFAEIDDAHAALAELAQDAVSPGDRAPDERIGHGRERRAVGGAEAGIVIVAR